MNFALDSTVQPWAVIFNPSFSGFGCQPGDSPRLFAFAWVSRRCCSFHDPLFTHSWLASPSNCPEKRVRFVQGWGHKRRLVCSFFVQSLELKSDVLTSRSIVNPE